MEAQRLFVVWTIQVAGVSDGWSSVFTDLFLPTAMPDSARHKMRCHLFSTYSVNVGVHDDPVTDFCRKVYASAGCLLCTLHCNMTKGHTST